MQGIVGQLDVEASVDSSGSAAVVGDKLRAFVLSGSPAVGYEGGNTSFAGSLHELLSAYGVDMAVKDLSRPGATAYDLQDIAAKALAEETPELVFIVGWSSDARVGRNSLGLPGLTEREAREQREHYRSLARYPLLADVLTSRIYRFLAGRADSAVHKDAVARVPVEEYQEQLRGVVDKLQRSGARVVLVSEPTVLQPEEERYHKVLQDIAQQSGAIYVDAQEALRARSKGSSGDLVARGRLLSDEGVETVAAAAFHRIAQVVLEAKQPTQLAQALSRTFPQADSLQHEYQLAGMRGEAVSLVVDPRQSAGDLIFKIRHLDSNRGYYRVVFSVNGTFVADRRLNDRDSTRVRFRIPDEFMKLPFVELSVRTVASPGREEDHIGSSDVTVPVPVSASGAQESAPLSIVKVAEQALRSSEPFAASSIDPSSGEVLESLATRQPEVMERWVKNQPWGAIVAGVSRASLSPDATRYIGVERPGGVFIGVAGSRSSAAALAGDLTQAISLGSSVVKNMNRFILEEATVESSGKTLLKGPDGA
jgi:hypothetical protein